MDALERDICDVGAIGGSEDGVTRLAWTPELAAAYAWLEARGTELGLPYELDPAGNAFLRWEAGTGPALLVGSHLDTVPRGGRYDGTLGVLTGLDVLRTLRERRFEPRRPIWLVSFMDEEGTRFGTALFGSRAFVGHDLSGLGDRMDASGTTLREAAAAWGRPLEGVPGARAIDRVGAYLELHIEQGPVLEREGIDLGIVTAIVGLLGLEVRYEGEANHAGTTPMSLRRDAFAGAARAALELRELALRRDDLTANVGTVRIDDEGKNVVPGVCTFTIDIRSSTTEGYGRLEEWSNAIVQRIAAEEGLRADVAELYRLAPVPMDPALVDALEAAAEAEGASHRRMPSGAGHDAQIVGAHVPAGMLFVPSCGGISHNPAERSEPSHCGLGSRVLARAVSMLAG